MWKRIDSKASVNPFIILAHKRPAMKNALEEIRDKLAVKRVEMDAIHDDITALERTLAILQANGKSQLKLSLSPRPIQNLHLTVNRGSLSMRPRILDIVCAALREAGKPLSSDEIVGACISRGVNSSKLSILGSVYRGAKEPDKQIKVVRPGVFGLKMWESGQK